MPNHGDYHPTIIDVQLDCQARISSRPDKLLGDGAAFSYEIEGSESDVFAWYRRVGTRS